MKRILVLLGLLLLPAPLLVAADAQPAVPQAGPTCPASVQAPNLPDSITAPLVRTACSISKDCPCGQGFVTISCSGNVSCTSQAFSITCDGVRYSCTMVDCNPPAGGGD